MNELERAVRILLAQTASAPELDSLERRARRRRFRHGMTAVAAALLIAIATVGVAGALGHHSSSPHVAVSPTTSTTSAANNAACGLGFLQQQKAQLQTLEGQLNAQLLGELAAHSANAGATDAAHQAVLRELSDVDQRILAAQTADGSQPDLGSPARALSPDDPRCATSLPAADLEGACWNFLDAQRAQLSTVEQQLTQQLTDELAAHSPNAGATDAAHQAVLREQIDLLQRILRLEESTPGSFTVPPADEPADPAEAMATWRQQFDFLDAQRTQLEQLVQQLNQQLTVELAAHSPNAANTDAAHQAVLRELSDVQQRILKLDQSRPGSPGPMPCPAADATSTTTVPSTAP